MRPVHTDLPAPTGGMLFAKRPTGITMAFVVVLLALIAQSIPGLITGIVEGVQQALSGAAFEPQSLEGFSGIQGAIGLFSFACIALFLWFWVAVKEKRRFATLGFTQPKSGFRLAARGFGVGVAMMALCVLVPVITGQAQLTWGSPTATNWAFILIMLLGFVVQGSVEEIMTRGYLTQAVARRWGLVAAVIIQAVFFTLLHGMNSGIGVLPIINLLLFAFFASFFSLAEGSLWGICAMHASWNWAQGNLFGVAVSGNPVSDKVLSYTAEPDSVDLLTGGAFGIEGSLVTTVVYAAGIVILWKVWQKRRATNVGGEVGSGVGADVGAEDVGAEVGAKATALTKSTDHSTADI